MTDGHERCLGPWTTTCQPLVDFVAKHAGTLEPLHDHGHVLAGVVIVVEALCGFIRVEDCNANHCCLLLHCTIQNACRDVPRTMCAVMTPVRRAEPWPVADHTCRSLR